MKLKDLNPVWITPSILAFDCPHCAGAAILTCKDIVLPVTEQMDAICKFYGECNGKVVVPCTEAMSWTFFDKNDFDTITITPSIDASAAGHWHGFITDGEIK